MLATLFRQLFSKPIDSPTVPSMVQPVDLVEFDPTFVFRGYLVEPGPLGWQCKALNLNGHYAADVVDGIAMQEPIGAYVAEGDRWEPDVKIGGKTRGLVAR